MHLNDSGRGNIYVYKSHLLLITQLSQFFHLSMYKCVDIYHNNVPFILRRARAPLQPRGTRAIHLIHSLFSDEDKDMLLDVRKKTYPSADELSLRLLRKGEKEPTTMKLSKALTQFEPFSYLEEIKSGTEEGPGTYRFLKFNDPGLPENKRPIGPMSTKYYKRRGRSKELHLNTDCPAALLRHRIKIAYAFLLEGSRLEFHLRSKAVGAAETVDSALRNHLHLRPDTILAAMPPGTTMLAVPGTAPPRPATLRRLTKVGEKTAVNKASDVFWAMENAEALKRYKVTTPPQIKAIGTWTYHQKFVKSTIDRIEARRAKNRLKKLANLERRSVDPRPKLSHRPLNNPDREAAEDEFPHLSELMPERERDDGSSASDAPPRSNFTPFHQTGRR